MRQALGMPSTIRGTISFTIGCKAMYITVYAKVQINGDTHGEIMFDIGVKQGCPLSPTLFSLYIVEFETHLDEIDGDSLCLFNTMVAILLYADDLFYSLDQEQAYKGF